MVKIYHNPRCTKSRETLKLLEDNHIQPQIVEYLTELPTKAELKAILKLLGISAFELLRKNEDIYKTAFKGKDLSEEEWIDAMLTHPKLIERPIVINGKKAVIGRPPERVLEIL
jgi:arsenate reductase